jgi:chromosome partitioning protein
MRERLASRIRKILSPEELLPMGGRQAQVISISNQKGGVGKTTTSVNLGAGLALLHHKKVLLVDMDAQGHIGTSLQHLTTNGIGIGDVLVSKNGSIMDVIVPTDVPHLDMTPSDHSLLDAESQLASTIGREFILRKALTRARTYYDFILIDCPPNLGNLTVNAYVASDYLLIPCDLSALALEGMEGILDVVDTVNLRLNHPLRLLGVLTTRVDRRNLVMNEAVFERLREVFSDKVFRTQITVNTDLNKAQLAGKPIFTYARSSAGAKDYQAFADEVIERLQALSNSAVL